MTVGSSENILRFITTEDIFLQNTKDLWIALRQVEDLPAHIFLDSDEETGFYIEETIEGNSIAQVLEYTQYHPKELVRNLKEQINEAIKSDRIKPNEGMRLLAEYEKGLSDHTYLTFQNGQSHIPQNGQINGNGTI